MYRVASIMDSRTLNEYASISLVMNTSGKYIDNMTGLESVAYIIRFVNVDTGDDIYIRTSDNIIPEEDVIGVFRFGINLIICSVSAEEYMLSTAIKYVKTYKEHAEDFIGEQFFTYSPLNKAFYLFDMLDFSSLLFDNSLFYMHPDLQPLLGGREDLTGVIHGYCHIYRYIIEAVHGVFGVVLMDESMSNLYIISNIDIDSGMFTLMKYKVLDKVLLSKVFIAYKGGRNFV